MGCESERPGWGRQQRTQARAHKFKMDERWGAEVNELIVAQLHLPYELLGRPWLTTETGLRGIDGRIRELGLTRPILVFHRVLLDVHAARARRRPTVGHEHLKCRPMVIARVGHKVKLDLTRGEGAVYTREERSADVWVSQQARQGG